MTAESDKMLRDSAALAAQVGLRPGDVLAWIGCVHATMHKESVTLEPAVHSVMKKYALLANIAIGAAAVLPTELH